jgi:hypothetical protein
MYRNVLIVSAVAAMAIGQADAQVLSRPSGYASPATERSITPGPGHLWDVPTAQTLEPQNRIDQWQVDQLVRWGEVGKCVVAKDREASLSYIAAKRKSPEAVSVAKRLDPAFASCLEGAGIPNKNNEAYRRAAIADAVGVRLSKGS